MARKQTDEQKDEAASPLLESIDPRQAAANNLTSTPNEDDPRGGDLPDPKDNPAGPNDVSAVVDPSDPMTPIREDAQPGENGQ